MDHRIAASDINFDIALDINGLAAQIAERGIDAAASGGRLDAVVRAARRAGLSSTLVGLVADQAAPAVARERAFGLLAVELAGHQSSPRSSVAA